MPQRRSVQVRLTLMVGTEAWIRVEHPNGWFKIPAWTASEQLLQGALEGWHHAPRKASAGEACVRVPLSEWLATTQAAAASRQLRPPLS